MEKSTRHPLLLVATGVGIGYTSWQMISTWLTHRRVRKKIAMKQKQCKAAFDAVKQTLASADMSGDRVMHIVQLSFTELQKQLQDGALTAVDVLHAYQTYALSVNDRLNCITEAIPEAEEWAQQLDQQTGKKGPLHGIPVSLKESYHLAGNDSTAGLGHFVGDIKTTDAVLVQVLKEQGAVPFVRTNIPQIMMTYECSNPVFGRTDNPYDVTRTPGGSSGGEAALLAAGASVLGLGSDIGGSIRVPAHFSGCYGLKTTLERLSRKGTTSLSSGQTLVSGTVGPMTRDLPGLVTFTKTLLTDQHFQLDPQIPPIKFRNKIYEDTRPLKIGFYVNDGYLPAVPACARAVLQAKQALEALGHTVVAFTPPRIRYAYPNLFIRSVNGDQGMQYKNALSKDIIDPVMKQIYIMLHLQNWSLWLVSYIIQFISRDTLVGNSLRARIAIRTVYDWFKHTVKVQEYKHEFFDAWRSAGLDAVICPPFATTAIPHGKMPEVLGGGSYSVLYNVLNYPAGSMPITKVTSDDVVNMKDYPRNTYAEKCVIKYTEGSEGLPVNVMCVGLPFDEELVLRVMTDIEQGLDKMSR